MRWSYHRAKPPDRFTLAANAFTSRFVRSLFDWGTPFSAASHQSVTTLACADRLLLTEQQVLSSETQNNYSGDFTSQDDLVGGQPARVGKAVLEGTEPGK